MGYGSLSARSLKRLVYRLLSYQELALTVAAELDGEPGHRRPAPSFQQTRRSERRRLPHVRCARALALDADTLDQWAPTRLDQHRSRNMTERGIPQWR